MAGWPTGKAKLGTDLRKLRAQCWCEKVISASGLNTAVLEVRFGKGVSGTGGRPRSCIWDKYRSGRVTPGADLVARVNHEFPGSGAWFDSPLWRLLDPAPLSIYDIRDVYDGLPEILRGLFIHPAQVEPLPRFWRRHHDETYPPEILCKDLLAYHGKEGLVALIAFLRESELIQDQYCFDLTAEALHRNLEQYGFSDGVRAGIRSQIDLIVDD